MINRGDVFKKLTEETGLTRDKIERVIMSNTYGTNIKSVNEHISNLLDEGHSWQDIYDYLFDIIDRHTLFH